MRVLAVEDDRRLAANLVNGLREEGFTVDAAGTAAAARQCLASASYDAVILDLGLPDGDGLAVLNELRARQPATPVIITTARGTLDERVAGLGAGADDYLVKPYAFAELIARLRALWRRARPASPPAPALADLVLDLRARAVHRGGRRIELTPREFDLLAYLLDAGRQVVTREMLARDVWHVRGRTLSMDNVIDVHISRLREKLDGDRPVRLLHTVRGVGFLLKEQA